MPEQTTDSLNDECPGCGKEVPPKMGIPDGYIPDWEWDQETWQRWCRYCYRYEQARRLFGREGYCFEIDPLDHGPYYQDHVSEYDVTCAEWNSRETRIISNPEYENHAQ